ncbi:hypothetical protein Thimo_0399 [Thioflavicoccus mobilis 8321]|uniref:Uncharacterized protein n=1 Tax=Thioflavicoccus mobilis 8321 TaxID=765912 RepID=L0GTX2_9GAMM|nr:hypothetical protein [Thioflavicoccus mobilis]AGA89262.1 hypothetical protein Thimo_0399 [Thioflavicoccus mobilis 8321]
MINSLQETLKRWLPFWPAYWLLILVLPLVAYSYTSPEEFLRLLQLTPTQDKITITKCLFAPIVLLLAMVVSHVLVVSRLLSIEREVKEETIKLKVGEYTKIKIQGDYEIKATLVKVSKERLPADYEMIGEEDPLILTESATLSFYPSQMYCGRRVKKIQDYNTIAEETFVLPVNKNLEAEESVYFYQVKSTTDKAFFFYCSVDHVNIDAKEAELSAFSFFASKNSAN